MLSCLHLLYKGEVYFNSQGVKEKWEFYKLSCSNYDT